MHTYIMIQENHKVCTHAILIYLFFSTTLHLISISMINSMSWVMVGFVWQVNFFFARRTLEKFYYVNLVARKSGTGSYRSRWIYFLLSTGIYRVHFYRSLLCFRLWHLCFPWWSYMNPRYRLDFHPHFFTTQEKYSIS